MRAGGIRAFYVCIGESLLAVAAAAATIAHHAEYRHGSDARMKICIVSDSHDRADALAQAVGEAKALGDLAAMSFELRDLGRPHSTAL